MAKKNKKTDQFKLLMHPTRLRIVQALMILNKATTLEIADEMPDIAQATLYRHIKKLEKADFITIVEENKVRGTVEKVYRLKENYLGENPSAQELNQVIDVGLLSIMGSFHQYFKKEDVDPKEDLYFMGTSTLMLTDEEMIAFTNKISEVLAEVIGNKPTGERKQRRITFISSPCENE